MRLAAIVVLCSSGLASAGPLADALGRHSDADVAMLRARGDPAARCTLGAVYARRADLSRAALYLRGCEAAELPEEIAAEVARIARDVKRTLRRSDLAVIEVVTQPDTAIPAEIDALPGETFTTPATLYLAPGEYTVRGTHEGAVVTNRVRAEPHSRGIVILELAPRLPATEPTPATHSIDFSDENATEPQTKGPPPKIEHGTLLPPKYERGARTTAIEANPFAIEDPLAHRDQVRRPRPLWLGLRLGGGVFDDGAAAARAGVAVAGAVRVPIARALFVAGRLDWSRRGGTSISTLGASAGLGRSLGAHVAVLAQLRGDLRLGDVMAARAGVSAAAAVEVALPRTPLSVGLRFEHGLTALAGDARDRALLVELGVDWR